MYFNQSLFDVALAFCHRDRCSFEKIVDKNIVEIGVDGGQGWEGVLRIFGSMLEVAGISFPDLSGLRLVMLLMLDTGTIGGVGMGSLL